jgi:hypothetical protein
MSLLELNTPTTAANCSRMHLIESPSTGAINQRAGDLVKKDVKLNWVVEETS